MTDLPLKDRIALVVGASRGIGYESALALAKAAWNTGDAKDALALLQVDQEVTEELLKKISASSHPHRSSPCAAPAYVALRSCSPNSDQACRTPNPGKSFFPNCRCTAQVPYPPYLVF